MIGLDNYTNYSFGIDFVNGYRFNDNLFLGVGTAFRFTDALYFTSSNSRFGWQESWDKKYLIPLYARAKINLSSSSVSPFLSANLGYTLDIGKNPNKNTKGLMFEPAFGVDFKLNNDNAALFLLFGFNMQKIQYKHFGGGASPEVIEGLASSLAIKAGIKF